MKIEGLTKDNAWAARALRDRGVATEELNGIQGEVSMEIEQVDLANHGTDLNFRPYLHLQGALRSVTPTERLPYGIHQVSFAPGQGQHVDAFYEFDDVQLSSLARKGYFNGNFQVPEKIIGVPWELPVTLDAVVLSPTQTDGIPVIFVNVHDLGSVNTDQESSGYDLTEYFDNQSLQAEDSVESVAQLGVTPIHDGQMNPMFEPEDLAHDDPSIQGVGFDAEALVEKSETDNWEAKLQEVAGQVDAEQEARHLGRAAQAGTLENVYEERVAKALAARVAAASEATVDAEDEAELQKRTQIRLPDPVPPVATADLEDDFGGSDLESVKKKVADRAADIAQPGISEDSMDY